MSQPCIKTVYVCKPKVNWSHCTGPSLDDYNVFLQFVTEHSYSQLVLFPTHLNNISGVILTNDPAVFGVVEPDCPVGTSDQSLILGSVLDTNMDHCHLWVPRCSIDGIVVIMNHLSFIYLQ